MAISRATAMWVVVISAVIYAGSVNVKAQMPAPAPGPGTPATDCMTLIYNMSDCLTYVEQGSNATKPDKACCPELAGMLDSNPICLCNLLSKSSDFPVTLDLSRALKLPTICGLQTPPLSLCSEVGIPVGSPTSSEGPSSSSSSGMAPGMVGEGLAPSGGNNGGSDAYNNVASLIAVGLALAFTYLFTL